MPRWLRVSGLVPDFSITQTHATLVPNNEDGVNFCEPRSKMAAEFLGSARRSQVWAIQGQPCILEAGVPGGKLRHRRGAGEDSRAGDTELLLPEKHLWNLHGPEGFTSPHPRAYPQACQASGRLAGQTVPMCLPSSLEGGFVSDVFSVDYREARAQ